MVNKYILAYLTVLRRAAPGFGINVLFQNSLYFDFFVWVSEDNKALKAIKLFNELANDLKRVFQ